MSDDVRPPVAIRITRPYATEDEFLEQELDTISRTGVTLVGAQQRPQGVVLRFELTLSSGLVLMRGEGRVTGFKPAVVGVLGGLTLRFTRLDSKSKALVDRAAALRERRRPSAFPAADSAPTSAPSPPDAPSSRPSSPAPPAPLSSRPVVPDAAPSAPVTAASLEEPAMESPALVATPPAQASARPQAAANGDRQDLLDRLRARARRLDATTISSILEQRRR